jgi:predicted negative regulator of RcsB-dependent stress response
MSQNLPVIVIEVVLIFGGVLAFGWWQLRDLKKEQDKTARERSAREAAEAREKAKDADATP